MTRWFEPVPPDVPYYCVVGSPIAHSRSPEIHTAFGLQQKIELRYERVEVAAGCFAAALAEFVAAGGRGLNVTVPLKEEAFAAADELLPTAERTGAANTIIVDADGTVRADNTDGRGLITDLLENHHAQLRGQRLLLLGAGGAARGVIPNLLEAGPATLVVANRTVARARELAVRFGDLGPISACGYGELGGDAYDGVINATSLSLDGALPPIPTSVVARTSWCYDMVYTASGSTPFLEWCASAGAAMTLDGLGMLVEQASAAFTLWHHVTPDTAPVIASLR